MAAEPATQTVERALARVDVGAIQRNCERLRATLAGGTELCAVVKADGYGHGAARCAEAALAGGASWLAVATAREAAELRERGLQARVLVMGALTAADAEIALAADADVVAWRAGFATLVAERAIEAPARVHVKLDTGMGRLGTRDPGEARRVADAVAGDERSELAGLMTHFATADEPGDEHFPLQLARFRVFVDELKADHPGVIAHAANSAATLREPASHFDLVRCGIAVYGLDPFQRDPADHGLEPALSLHSHVGRVERFESGAGAGYGQTWHAAQPTWLATLPIGYGDGWRRGLSNRCDVLIHGRRRPLVGTVSMDNVTVDLGPEGHVVQPGEPAVLIGAQGEERILCEEVAGKLDTINYEVTCGLSPRVPRRHSDGAQTGRSGRSAGRAFREEGRPSGGRPSTGPIDPGRAPDRSSSAEHRSLGPLR
ncbi:MAG: alanine racemase [Actinomycetota bacterium]|nr:alanine racemase [Actinomycetota bacterium]